MTKNDLLIKAISKDYSSDNELIILRVWIERKRLKG